MPGKLDVAYEQMAGAIVESAKGCSTKEAFAMARQVGMIEQPHSSISQKTIFEMKEGERMLWFQWRYYDQSQVFSVRPDRNLLTVKLLNGEKVERETTTEYED